MLRVFGTVRISILILVAIFYFTLPSSFADESNATKSIFSASAKTSPLNTYVDNSNYFSILPPANWSVLKNIPPNISNNALVVFSNKNGNDLATMSIFYRVIPVQPAIEIIKYSDNNILDVISNELVDNQSSTSQTTILQKSIERFSDGFIAKLITTTHYSDDNSSIQNEDVVYFLSSGDQYTLILTSKPESFNNNSIEFEKSVNTFYANLSQILNENQIKIPRWIKNNANWWGQDLISDSDFVHAIQFMVQKKIIIIPQGHPESGVPQLVPWWFKNNSILWAHGHISDKDFAKGLLYLINNDIIIQN